MLSSLITTGIVLASAAVATVFSGAATSPFGQLAAVASTSATVANAVPSVLSINVSGHTGAPSSSFERTIQFSGVVNDQNGDADISDVSVILYRNGNPLSEHCTADPNQCYRITQCPTDVGYGTATEVHYACSVSIAQAYAFGAWTAIVRTVDFDSATGTASTSVPVEAFVFGGTIGGMPTTTPPAVTPPVSTPGRPVGTEPGKAPTTPSSPIGFMDPITLFYTRIAIAWPETRFTPQHTESYNEPMRVSASDTGLLVYDFSDAPDPDNETTRGIAVEIPANASRVWLTLYAEALPIGNYPTNITNAITYRAIDPFVFSVSARNHANVPAESILGAMRVTLIVPEDLFATKDVGLYRFNRETALWEPVPYIATNAHIVVFSTTSFGEYAFLAPQEKPLTIVDRAKKEAARFGIILILLGTLFVVYALLIHELLRERAARMRKEKAVEHTPQ